MESIRRRLTYANVVSTLALFLVLGGTSAIAAKKIGAKQLKAGSVTAAKLKRNAVTTAKIRNGAVTAAKLRNGAVDGAKLADGSVTGAEINAASTPFGQVFERLRGTVQLPFTPGAVYPLANPTYTQPAGRSDQYLGFVDVRFADTCVPPRAAQAFLLVDPQNPAAPTSADIAGLAVAQDLGAGGGTVTRRATFGTYAFANSPMQRFAPPVDTTRTFYVYFAAAVCTGGSGITGTGAGVDVIGAR